MINFIRERISLIKKDHMQWFTIAMALFLSLCHTWQYFDSHFLLQPLFRCIFYPSLALAVFIFGRNGVYYGWLIFSLFITTNLTFDIYTYFVICALFCIIKTSGHLRRDLRFIIPVLSVYTFSACIACQLHDKDVSHLLIHISGCVILFLALNFIRKRTPAKALILDADQKRILRELAEGKKQKEITFLSKNTIHDKIENAIEINKLLSKEHLLMRFIAEYIEVQ